MSNNTSKKIDFLIEEAMIQNEINFFMQELQESSFKDITDKSKKMIINLVKVFKDPEKINKIISEEKVAQKRRKDYLKKYNINTDELTRDLKEGKDISIPLKMIFEEMFSGFLDILKPNKSGKTMFSIFIILVMAVIVNVLITTLSVILPFREATLLYKVIFAPIIEETIKRVSTKFNLSGISFLGFNALEIENSLKKLTPNNMNLADISTIGLSRIIAVLFHLITWMMHIKGNLLDKYKSDFKIEDNQKNKYKNAASFQATLAHSLYNGLPQFLADSDAMFLTIISATTAGGLTVLEKTKAKKEFSRAVDKFLKPLRGQKIPAKITA